MDEPVGEPTEAATMTGRAHWRDAVAAAERLTEGDRRTLRLLAHLPLLWEGAIEQLSGARAGVSGLPLPGPTP